MTTDNERIKVTEQEEVKTKTKTKNNKLKNSNNSVINSAENTSEKSNNDKKANPAVNKQAEPPKTKIQTKNSSMVNDIVNKNPETVEMLDYSVKINHESKQTNEETSVGSSFGFYFLFFSHFNTLIVSSHCHSS
jgi:DNA mismatch repair ATPase MutL